MTRSLKTTDSSNGTNLKRGIKTPLCLFAFFIMPVLLGVLFLDTKIAEAAAIRSAADYALELMTEFDEAFAAVEDKVHGAALGLFGALFTCQMAWAFAQLFISGEMSFTSFFTTAARQTLTGGFFYWLLFDRAILGYIIDSFAALANTGEASSRLTVSRILALYEYCLMQLTEAFNKKYAGMDVTQIPSLIGTFIYFGIAGIVFSYTVMKTVGLLVIVAVEQYITVTLGIIFMGFGGSDYTRDYALNYIKKLVSLGFKLFALTVTCFIAMRQFTTFIDSILAAVNNDPLGTSLLLALTYLIAMCILILVIIDNIPALADAIMAAASLDTKGAIRQASSSTVGAARSAKNMAGRSVDKAKNAAKNAAAATKDVASAFKNVFGF